MRHLFKTCILTILPLAIAGCDHPDPIKPPPPQPTGACAGMTARNDLLLSGASVPHGKYLLWLDHRTNLDLELVGGGGGGGSSRAGGDHLLGGGGGAAEAKPIFQLKQQERDYYLIEVGAGGAGGVGPNWSDSIADGKAGGDTRLSRCSSGAEIAVSHGGAGGKGDSATARRVGNNDFAGDGASFVNATTGREMGHGGAGGGWQASGEPAAGFGAGGGGQGGTTHPGQSHGGNGADGFARIIVIS